MDQLLETGRTYAEEGLEIALRWLTSPAAYAQFGLLIAAYILALIVTGRLRPRLTRLLSPGEEDVSPIAKARRFVLIFLPLLLPLLAYAFAAAAEQVTRSLLGSGAVLAFGKRVFIFLAVRRAVADIVSDPFLKLLGRYIAIPLAVLYALGLLSPIGTYLEETRVSFGNISFSVLALFRAAIAGSILFWLGRWSADTGSTYIRAQETMRPPTRELAAKAFELAIFVAVGLILLNVMGLNLSALAIFGGAVGVGLGFGLQKIASSKALAASSRVGGRMVSCARI